MDAAPNERSAVTLRSKRYVGRLSGSGAGQRAAWLSDLIPASSKYLIRTPGTSLRLRIRSTALGVPTASSSAIPGDMLRPSAPPGTRLRTRRIGPMGRVYRRGPVAVVDSHAKRIHIQGIQPVLVNSIGIAVKEVTVDYG